MALLVVITLFFLLYYFFIFHIDTTISDNNLDCKTIKVEIKKKPKNRIIRRMKATNSNEKKTDEMNFKQKKIQQTAGKFDTVSIA